MKKEICTIIACLVCLTCVTYRHIGIVIPEGARLKIDCGYEESLNFYDVTAFYVENAEVESSVSIREFENYESETLIFSLVRGNKVVLRIYGSYSPHPDELDGGLEEFNCIMVLDTICISDTISFASDSIDVHFYYDRSYMVLNQNGYTTELDGYLVANSQKNDTLSGIVSFSGETTGSYRRAKISDDNIESWVSNYTQFTAIRREFKKEPAVIGHLLRVLRKKESED